MSAYDLTHLRDDALLRGLDSLAAQDRTTTANLLAHIAEVDARRLYAPAGYSSMHAYCVEKLKLSDDSTWKRLQVARQGRRFPQVFSALADGRVHLSGLVVLAPHFRSDNVDSLLSEATGRRKSEIEVLVARHFPQVEALRLDEGIAALPVNPPGIPSAVVGSPAPGQVTAAIPSGQHQARIAPIAAQRFSMQVTIEDETHELLRRAQDLLATREVPRVLHRALKLLVDDLERQKAALTEKPRSARPSDRARNLPAEVRRAVWKRDGGQCTFVSADGHRCGARRWLEFDHVVPVARGGRASVDQIRLRCRTHNQLEAERVFGQEFMEQKRKSG
jgi:hypothetical protein